MRKIIITTAIVLMLCASLVLAADVTISGKVIGFKPGTNSSTSASAGGKTISGDVNNIEEYSTLQSPTLSVMLEPTYNNFLSNPETTDFSTESNLSAVTNPVLADNNNKGKIEFFGVVNADGANLDDAITISDNFVRVDSSMLPTFNKPANITFRTVSYPNIFSYNVLKNGEICSDCVKYSANPVKFKVTGFSNYTTNGTGIVPEFSSGSLMLSLVSVAILLFIIIKKKNKR